MTVCARFCGVTWVVGEDFYDLVCARRMFPMVVWVTLSRVNRSYLEVLSLVDIFIRFRQWSSGLSVDIVRRGFFSPSLNVS